MKKPRRQRRGFPCVTAGKGQTKPAVPAHRRRRKMPHALKWVPHQKMAARKPRGHLELGITFAATHSFSVGKEWRLIRLPLQASRFCQDHWFRLMVTFAARKVMHAGPTKALDQHPFVARLLQHIDLNADDLKTWKPLSMTRCRSSAGEISSSMATNFASSVS